MKNVRFLFLGAILTIAGTSAMLAGCGDDTGGTGGGTTGTGGSGTTATGTGDMGTGGDATTTTTSSTTSTGTGMPVTPDCASYCTAVETNCKGAQAQYPSTASCLAACAALPVGKFGDTDGNSVGCRLYHGGAPAIADAVTHCPHAGPTGGDKDVTDAAAATCGEGCDAFCTVATKVCATTYKDKDTCLTDCKTFKPDVASYSTANTDKDDFGCRFYHLSVAATDAASATAHCGHITGASTTCTK
jgi:hypothetical protein